MINGMSDTPFGWITSSNVCVGMFAGPTDARDSPTDISRVRVTMCRDGADPSLAQVGSKASQADTERGSTDRRS
jgi:hypothetical protein